MTEQTPTQENQTDLFEDVYAMQAARRVLEDTPVTPEQLLPISTPEPEDDKETSNRKRLVGAGVIATLAVGGLGVAAYETFKAPEFSEETTTYTVQDGDGLHRVAEEIKGIDTVDIRDAVDHISVDPANIDALKDGLQAGESIVIPVSVESYDEKEE